MVRASPRTMREPLMTLENHACAFSRQASRAEAETLDPIRRQVQPGDGGSLGNLSAREALAKAAGVEVSEAACEAGKERLLAWG